MERIRCIADDRERDSEVCRLLVEQDDFDTQVRRLTVGDYDVYGRFLFERKTLVDLVASIKSGRLFSQALRLAAVEDRHPALILEGTGVALRGSDMRWEAIQGALVTVAVFIGLPVLRTRTPAETLRTFAFTAQQGRTVATRSLSRRGRRPKGKAALQRHVLQGLPTVGPERARQLLRHFGSIHAVLNASEAEITAVPGIGRETARRIAWAVNESRAVYAVDR